MRRFLGAFALFTVALMCQQIDWISGVRNKPFLDVRQYAWSQTPAGTISIGSNTITLPSGPLGLNGSDSNHPIYISGPGSPATYAITGVVIPTSSVSQPYNLKVSSTAGLVTGNIAVVSGSANVFVNGAWTITVIDGQTIGLSGSQTSNDCGNLISTATNASPIVIGYCEGPLGFQTGDSVTIAGGTGNTAVNGTFTVTAGVDAMHVSLNGSTGNGTYNGSTATISGTASAGGTLTMGPEAPVITGGSCVPGKLSCTITFTAANAHAAGYSIGSACNGGSEAIVAAVSSGQAGIYYPSGSFTCYAGLTIPQPGNFTITGSGKGSTSILAYPVTPTFHFISASGMTDIQTTSTTNITEANRFTPTTSTFGVSSAIGITPGAYIYLDSVSPITGRSWTQISTVSTVSGSNITLDDPVLVPLFSAQPNGVSVITPVRNLYIGNFLLDGQSIGFDRYANVFDAIDLQIVADSTVENVRFQNWTSYGGLYGNIIHNSDLINLSAKNSGTDGSNDLNLNAATLTRASHWSSIDANGFGPGSGVSTRVMFSQMQISHPRSRDFKVIGCAWCFFSDISFDRSGTGNGIQIGEGSYRNIFTGLSGTLNPVNENIEFEGDDNQYNLINGAVLLGAGIHDLSFNSSSLPDANNVVLGLMAGTSGTGDIIDGSNGLNQIGTAVKMHGYAYNSTAQAISSATFSVLTFDTNYALGGANAWDTSGTALPVHSTTSNTSQFVVQAGQSGTGSFGFGIFQACGSVSFAGNATGLRYLSIEKNGGGTYTGTVLALAQGTASSAGDSTAAACWTGPLSLGDYIEFYGYQSSGGSLNTVAGVGNTYGSLIKIF